MGVKIMLEEIENDVNDVVNTNFVYEDTGVVPNKSDSDLTYESGVDKKGKKIKTCVLFVDIRNSVSLTEKHHNQTMGKIYTAFTKAVLKAARYHKGHIRNIIGDRVMIIFPSKDCFTNAVECAISISHIAQNIIAKSFNAVEFKCGIGIDYGEMRVIKVGIQRYGTENEHSKGLVWVGLPANIASRLTDSANKKIEETYYEVLRHPINLRKYNMYLGLPPIYNSFFHFEGISKLDNSREPEYLPNIETLEMTLEEFANQINCSNTGELKMIWGKFVKFTKKTRTTIYPEILMTEEVYNGFKKANPQNKSIQNNYWKVYKHHIKNVDQKIYGGNVFWNSNNI
ncbi:MAG: adenylate/guanylate cyclase domain-containing protein [Bacteroidetes bacterium]|nr:adenylate/guanylate cyclase domain-containing protein [Bacteroidota bacterium]